MNFLLGWRIFRGELVSFREGNPFSSRFLTSEVQTNFNHNTLLPPEQTVADLMDNDRFVCVHSLRVSR